MLKTTQAYHMQWKRPVSFTSKSAPSTVLGLSRRAVGRSWLTPRRSCNSRTKNVLHCERFPADLTPRLLLSPQDMGVGDVGVANSQPCKDSLLSPYPPTREHPGCCGVLQLAELVGGGPQPPAVPNHGQYSVGRYQSFQRQSRCTPRLHIQPTCFHHANGWPTARGDGTIWMEQAAECMPFANYIA